MRRLVDAMNVIGSKPDGWWKDRDAAGRRLVEALERWAAATGEEVAVVFDGRPFAVDRELVDVAWAERSGPDAADEVIAARVATDDEPSSLCVVTSDATLAERVRAAGGVVEGAGGFRRRLGY
jgi:predicted RNA-binding protein with PIN domain